VETLCEGFVVVILRYKSRQAKPLWTDILAAAGDVRVLRFGLPRGGPRLARHLWRMCFALFIAAGSFFSIRERVAKILPEPFTAGPIRALPILHVASARPARFDAIPGLKSGVPF
jgi:hypothetical protein